MTQPSRVVQKPLHNRELAAHRAPASQHASGKLQIVRAGLAIGQSALGLTTRRSIESAIQPHNHRSAEHAVLDGAFQRSPVPLRDAGDDGKPPAMSLIPGALPLARPLRDSSQARRSASEILFLASITKWPCRTEERSDRNGSCELPDAPDALDAPGSPAAQLAQLVRIPAPAKRRPRRCPPNSRSRHTAPPRAPPHRRVSQGRTGAHPRLLARLHLHRRHRIGRAMLAQAKGRRAHDVDSA